MILIFYDFDFLIVYDLINILPEWIVISLFKIQNEQNDPESLCCQPHFGQLHTLHPLGRDYGQLHPLLPAGAGAAAVCVVGNGLVCLVLIKNHHMRSVTNLFILNLAISDLLVGIFFVPTTLIDSLISGQWAIIFHLHLCI